VVFDPTKQHIISVEHDHMDVDYCAYEGKDVQSQIDVVLSRGKVIIQGDEYDDSAGDGRYLKV
jgi:dihydropyrimidinase